MKLNSNKKIKRLGVFVFYDRDGIIDKYVLNLLSSLKETTDDIIIVSNTYLGPRNERILKEYSNKIHVRKNVGLDAGAFKEMYDLYHEYFKKFDELILLNDTFFGPFESFKSICKTMESKNVDFWGLSANYDSVDGYKRLPDGMIHSHIQTFFIVFRNNVLISKSFNTYWNNYDISKMMTFEDVVINHELAFTYYLEKNGFKWDVYSDLKKYHSKNIDENFNCYAYASYDMIKNLNAPFLKRKNLVFEKKDLLFLSDGNDSKKSLDYLEKNGLYDVQLIWDNIVRLYSAKEIYYGLNMNYVISENEVNDLNEFALLIILSNKKNLDLYIDFINKTDIKNVFVFSKDKEIINILNSEKIKTIEKNDFLASKYNYIGILNDVNKNSNLIPVIFEDNLNNVINNGFKNQNYINTICALFKKNKYISLILFPNSMHGEYFKVFQENDIIPASENACIIKSEIFEWDDLLNDDFVKKQMNFINENKKLFCKVYNQNDVSNYLLTNEYMLNETYKKLIKRFNLQTKSFSETLNNIEFYNNYENKYIRFIKRVIKKILKMK